MSHTFFNQEITNHFQLKMFCQISQVVKMSSMTGDFMPKSGRSHGLFHNGSAYREEQLLTEDASRIYHCTKFSILVLAT
jgi:hypothetical protein